MRIAYLIHHVSRRAAGVLEVVKAQAQALGARGHTVTVFGYDDPNDPGGAPGALESVPVESTGTALSMAQGYSPRLERKVIDFRPDILHTHGIWTGLSLTSLRAQTRTRAPLVISPHGMLDPWALRHKQLKKRLIAAVLERRHLGRAQLLQALTAAEAADLGGLGLLGLGLLGRGLLGQGKGQGRAARIAVIPNGVAPPPQWRETQVPPWKPSSRRRVLLFLGRIHDKKGVLELVEAFERLADELSDWRLVIAGFGEPADEARLRIRLQGARASEFIGRQGPEGRHACYAAATAFVLPSHSEGLPMTVLEAWSHGKPALISPACHLEQGEAVGAALPVTPDPAGLALGLRALAALSDEELELRGRAAVQLVRTEFSWQRIGAELESEYQRLLQE